MTQAARYQQRSLQPPQLRAKTDRMRIHPYLLSGVACLALSACAGLPKSDRAVALDTDLGASAYGQYLAGQAAANHGESGVAQGYFGKAAGLDTDVDTTLLNTRAFTSALLAGDITAAAALAPTGEQAETGLRHLGALVRGVEALSDGRPKAARAVLTGPDAGAPNEPAAALLTPFAAAAAGDAAGSIVHPVIAGEPIAQFFASLDQGLLFERARRYDEAETAYRALIAKGDPGGIASLNLGQMLERRGRAHDAVAIYDSAISAKKGGDEIETARARAAGGKPAPPAPSLRALAAEALVAPATALLAEKQQEIALAYLRLALRLDPTRDEAWMMVGDILGGGGDDPAARAAYEKVRPAAPQYVAARTNLAWSHQSAGEKDAALAVARELIAAHPEDGDAMMTYADLLRADERFIESAHILDGMIQGKSAPDWKLLYMRAVDYEESDRWGDAEKDLQAALKQRPDEPELLNFLGYSWIDRGVKLPEAMAMVQKAVSLQPESGAMIDSLGWGYFRMGDYPAAVEKLEAAVVLEPGDPDVNDHLGDAYWKIGRKIEAGFQWRRVLTLEPSAKLKAQVEAKLRHGLDPVPAAPVVAVK